MLSTPKTDARSSEQLTIGFDDVEARYSATEPDDGEVLSDLRRGWLADVEAFPERHTRPKPPSLKVRLLRQRQHIANGFLFWIDCAKRVTAGIRRPSPQQTAGSAAPLAGTRPLIARASVPTSGPVAPPAPEEVLELREGWLADTVATPERHAPRRMTWRMGLHREFEPILEELAYWFQCIKEYLLRASTPKSERRRISSRERVRKAEAAGRFISAAFVIVLVAGTVLYVATVVHVFNPSQVSQILNQ